MNDNMMADTLYCQLKDMIVIADNAKYNHFVDKESKGFYSDATIEIVKQRLKSINCTLAIIPDSFFAGNSAEASWVHYYICWKQGRLKLSSLDRAV